MTVGQDLMKKYPIGVTERIAKEVDAAIDLERARRAVSFGIGLIIGGLLVKVLYC